jgi:hypothetical protein
MRSLPGPVLNRARSSLLAVLVVGISLAAGACAHPNEVPLPGESPSPTPRVSRTTQTTGADETAEVCREAQDESEDAVATLTDQLDEASTAYNAGKTAEALAAYNEAKETGTEWADTLDELAGRPIEAKVRTVLEDGSEMITDLVNTPPQNIDPEDAEDQINEFLDDLDAACS